MRARSRVCEGGAGTLWTSHPAVKHCGGTESLTGRRHRKLSSLVSEAQGPRPPRTLRLSHSLNDGFTLSLSSRCSIMGCYSTMDISDNTLNLLMWFNNQDNLLICWCNSETPPQPAPQLWKNQFQTWPRLRWRGAHLVTTEEPGTPRDWTTEGGDELVMVSNCVTHEGRWKIVVWVGVTSPSVSRWLEAVLTDLTHINIMMSHK